MLSEHGNQLAQAVQVPASLEFADPQTAIHTGEPRFILVAEAPKYLVSEVRDRAEELRSALGFELRFLPAERESDSENQLEIVLREAAAPDVALVVMASPPLRREGGRATQWHELLRRCQRPLLFVAPHTSTPVIVAASDCSDPALPVVRDAGLLATALRGSLTLVHNIDSTASQFAQRVGLPLSRQLADLLALRLHEQLEQSGVQCEIVITREVANADAILEVAQAQSADLLIIGVKPLDAVQTRTADAILDAVSQSVLFIPLLSASKTLLLD